VQVRRLLHAARRDDARAASVYPAPAAGPQRPPLEKILTIPRDEYPRPQFVRPDWLCLNGEWEFEIDQGDSGLERGLLTRSLGQRIQVPFCPESELSGIHERDFLNAVWYRRTLTLPPSWQGREVLLHFQAVDYDATVWVDGHEAGRHRGGFSPFTVPLRDLASPGAEVEITLRARDFAQPPQPRGKQAQTLEGFAAWYGRTTGIWQTVWLEPVPQTALARTRITPDVGASAFHLEQPLVGNSTGMRVVARLSENGRALCEVETPADSDLGPRLSLQIPKKDRRLWSPADPFLYDLEIELVAADGSRVDHVSSYAGLRGVTIDGPAIRLNGRSTFQRLVLDQGYYPGGIMTAPSDDALIRDIELAQAAGFNGARLHQKVFEERFLYHADRLGYLVWGEFGDWGCRDSGSPRSAHQKPGPDYITQWLEVLARDYSHPSIVGWCPLNETWQHRGDQITQLDDVTRGMFLATKAMDTTRPVLDASGYSHRVPETDVYDSHDYDQDVETFRERHAGLARRAPYVNTGRSMVWSLPWAGQPYFVSEFGGIWWNPEVAEDEDSWGYGARPRTVEEFYARFEGLCSVLLSDANMFGYCYTQLTDIDQEQNGIYKFDRSPKFDSKRLAAAQLGPAAIEDR
jgi:beta-galactosidase/beta-glucuronidase